MARRFVALVLALSFAIPSDVHAVGSVISYGMQMLQDEDEETIAPIINEDAIARDEAAAQVRDSLKLDGTGTKKVRLKVAKTLAIATSEKIESYDMQVDAKTASMQSAVRSLRERERSMQTIRWSPLFNIKFPETPNEEESFEFEFKPTQLQNQITTIKHHITETEMDINEKVSVTYISIISAQNAVTTLEDRHRKLQSAVAKLEIKVEDGTAAVEEGVIETDEEGNEVAVSPRVLKARLKQAQTRLETAQKRLTACETELANARTEFEEAKRKLSTLIGLDVTTGYTFEDAFVTANLNRDVIESLYAIALDDDPTVYEAQMNYDEALLTLRLNYTLMKSQYSRDIPALEPYIQQALDGEKVNKKAFKNDYDQFLKDIDSDWQGSYKIWFIKIPKEWLKGEVDGIRYIEDDPYVLYSAVLDYESASKELTNAQSELYNQIYEEYSTYASTRKAYLNANSAYVLAEKQLGIDEIRYLLGELSQEEFETEESEYNSLKDDAADALKEFSETLYSFDRTTCGGLSKYLEGPAQSQTEEVLSLVPVIRRGCIYTLRPIIDSEEFLLSIDVPDDFYAETGINITHFELYADGHQIGERTEVGKNLRHLALSVRELGECAIRVYDGNTFIDECLIEPTVFSGPLNITIGYEDDVDAHTLGTYYASDEVSTDMLVLTLTLDQEEVRSEYENGNDAAYYRLAVATDSYLLSDRLVPVNQQFTYMSFLKGDLENVFIELFDANMGEIGIAKFDTKTNEIYNDIDEDEAAALAEKKRQQAIERAAAEEAAAEQAEAEARRQAAIELLNFLGLTTDNASIVYALEHLNQLTYSAELINARESLIEEHELDLQKYEILKNDPDADPSALRLLENRLRITELMPEIYAKTMSDEEKVIEKELEERKQLYIKELVAEYAVNYNGIKSETVDVAAAESRMAEIETEVAEYGSDAVEVFKQAVIPFEEALEKLYAYGADDFYDADRMEEYAADYNTCNSKLAELEASGYGTGYEPRLKKAVYVGFLKVKPRAEALDPENPPTIYDITDEMFTGVETLNAAIDRVSKYLIGTSYVAEVEETCDRLDEYYRALAEVEEARKLKISEYNTELAALYGQIMPPDESALRLKGAQTDLDNLNEKIKKNTEEMENYKEMWDKYKSIGGLGQSFANQYQAFYYDAEVIDEFLKKALVIAQQNLTAQQVFADETHTAEIIAKAETVIKTITDDLHGTADYTVDDFNTKSTISGQEHLDALDAELEAYVNEIDEAVTELATAKKEYTQAQKDVATQAALAESLRENLLYLGMQPRVRGQRPEGYDEAKEKSDSAFALLETMEADAEAKKQKIADLEDRLKSLADSAIATIDYIELLGGEPAHSEDYILVIAGLD